MMRYAFNNPITWADQVATYGLVYLTFIGAPRVLAADLLAGLAISAPVYWMFTKLLNINLPGLTGTGWL